MRSLYSYSFERFSGLLEDKFTDEIFAESEQHALLMLVADFRGFSAATETDACAKANAYLDTCLGEQWTVADFLRADSDVWSEDGLMCYRLLDCAPA